MPTWIAGALGRLGDGAPPWFGPLCEDLADRCAPPVAAAHMRKVERLAAAGATDPAVLIAALRIPGRSPGAIARLVDEFFARTGDGHLQQEAVHRAHRRRQRRLDSVPTPMRPAVTLFTEYLLASRARAGLVGRRGLADGTIEARMADLALLATRLIDNGITDWASVATADIETFLTINTGQRLATCRAFFAFARRRKLILVDPTRTITRTTPRGFAGRILDTDQQRRLLRRWMGTDIDPRERVVGLLSLIHGASCAELRQLLVTDIDLHAATIQLGDRPHRLPLDPLSSAAIRDALSTRTAARTRNAHLVITKASRSHESPCSPHFMSHVLDDAGVTPAVLRQTRLADLTHQVDPRLVAAAFGMTEGGALHYVTDAVRDEQHAFSSDL